LERLELLIQLAVEGRIMLKADQHDLLDKGIIHIQSLAANKTATYGHLEPLMMRVIYNYLESKGIYLFDIIVQWMAKILDVVITDSSSKEVRKAQSFKGKAAEVLLAQVLVMMAKDLEGEPITNSDLFSKYKGTFLDDYTLLADKFQHDNSIEWKDILLRRATDILLLPPNLMRPDIFGLLKCIKDTPSFKKFGDHEIPLTARCKLYSRANKDKYQDSFDSTNFWDIFTKYGRTIKNAENSRKDAEKLISTVFKSKRALRINFLYNPLNEPLPFKTTEDEIEVTFDFHNDNFADILKKHAPQARELLNMLILPSKVCYMTAELTIE
jgi:hypothetical protein